MTIRVASRDGSVNNYDNADAWTEDPDGVNITKNSETVAFHYADTVKFVCKTKKEDLSLMLEEAKELIGLVDGGNWGNQDSDWKERAEELMENLS